MTGMHTSTLWWGTAQTQLQFCVCNKHRKTETLLTATSEPIFAPVGDPVLKKSVANLLPSPAAHPSAPPKQEWSRQTLTISQRPRKSKPRQPQTLARNPQPKKWTRISGHSTNGAKAKSHTKSAYLGNRISTLRSTLAYITIGRRTTLNARIMNLNKPSTKNP